jgi:chromosome segregation ATPase
MGWVSYLEDITDRLTNDLNQYRASLSSSGAGAAELRRQAEGLLIACETALAEISKHLELATDPHFDMAYEITQLDKEKAELEGEIRDLTRRRLGLVDEITRLTSEGGELRQQIKQLERQVLLANQDFDRLAEVNPDAAFDLYTSEEHIRTHKPEADR